MTLDPDLYRAFARFRLQPALDLLQRLAGNQPRRIYDLGCGTGDVTRRIAERWPNATVIGIDSSPEMLAQARRGGGPITWVEGDAAAEQHLDAPDLLFSNAVFNWIPWHAEVLPRLCRRLGPDGLLALQIPRNYLQPSHRAIVECIDAGPWRRQLTRHTGDPPVHPGEAYYRMLAPHVAALDIWETDYFHVLRGEDPVFTWVSGTALRPVLADLEPEQRPDFERELKARLRRTYPPERDGSTIFPIRRLFLLARR
ncbi:MAG: methyltransferase domain-containing protein [Alphaproteobacteria bacterium]|nr:methyltransferase domain-containing protein [Alphaproteobacteria bacterium]